MTMSLTRRATASVVALGTFVAVGTASTAASAAPGDPVTSGTTTISVPVGSAFSAVRKGIVAFPTKPATVTYAKTTKTVDYALPVSGGDGSGKAGYGSITHDGGIIVTNISRGRSTELTSFTFSLETFVLSATPSGSTTPVDIAELTGSNTFNFGTAGEQTLNSTQISLTRAGAAYLDKALSTKVFKAGQAIGTFNTTFVNTQY